MACGIVGPVGLKWGRMRQASRLEQYRSLKKRTEVREDFIGSMTLFMSMRNSSSPGIVQRGVEESIVEGWQGFRISRVLWNSGCG